MWKSPLPPEEPEKGKKKKRERARMWLPKRKRERGKRAPAKQKGTRCGCGEEKKKGGEETLRAYSLLSLRGRGKRLEGDRLACSRGKEKRETIANFEFGAASVCSGRGSGGGVPSGGFGPGRKRGGEKKDYGKRKKKKGVRPPVICQGTAPRGGREVAAPANIWFGRPCHAGKKEGKSLS